jgi:hypothetical protein
MQRDRLLSRQLRANRSLQRLRHGLCNLQKVTGMSIQLQMEQMPGYLAARFIGVGVRGEASQQFELIAEHCKLTNNVFLRRAGVRSRKKCASADESSQSIASCNNGWSKYLSFQMKR